MRADRLPPGWRLEASPDLDHPVLLLQPNGIAIGCEDEATAQDMAWAICGHPFRPHELGLTSPAKPSVN